MDDSRGTQAHGFSAQGAARAGHDHDETEESMAEKTEDWRGEVGKMSDDYFEEFLRKPLLMELACLTPDGGPYITVAWHLWKDNAFWLVARERAPWAKYMQDDPRVSFIVHQWEPMEKVWGEGKAEIAEEPNVGGKWVGIGEDMARKYLGSDGPSYLVPTLQQPRWLIKVNPDTVKTWRGVAWARRYWVDSDKGPSYEEAMGLKPTA